MELQITNLGQSITNYISSCMAWWSVAFEFLWLTRVFWLGLLAIMLVLAIIAWIFTLLTDNNQEVENSVVAYVKLEGRK